MYTGTSTSSFVTLFRSQQVRGEEAHNLVHSKVGFLELRIFGTKGISVP